MVKEKDVGGERDRERWGETQKDDERGRAIEGNLKECTTDGCYRSNRNNDRAE